MAGCARAPQVPRVPQAVRDLPPDYREKVLEERAGLEHLLRDYRLILESIDHLISIRESGRIQRGPGGGVFLSDDRALRSMRLETERHYDYTLGTLWTLESQVKRDFGGALPTWWEPLRSP